MSNNTFQSAKKTTEPLTPPQLQKKGQEGLSEQRERRILDIFCKQRGGTDRSRQLALGQWHSSTPTGSGMPQVSPFPKLTCTGGQGGAQEAKQDLAVLAVCTHTLYPIKHLLLQSISRARHSTRNSWTATHWEGKQWFSSSDRDIELQSPSHPPQKGQSCFIHPIFGRTGGAVTFPTNRKTSEIRGFTWQEVLHLHRKHILSFIIKATGKVTNWVIL